MNTYINKLLAFGNRLPPKLKQWLWFVGLWLCGLLTVLILAYPLKLLIKIISR